MKYQGILAGFTAALMMNAASAAHAQTLTVLVDSGPEIVATMEALAAAYSEQNPGVSFDIETRPGGAEGENLVKTRLATGSMSDIFQYNTGSQLTLLNPSRTLVDVSDLPAQQGVARDFQRVVSAEGAVYGVPFGSARAGGILYNMEIYDRLGLEVPTTWEEFMANNAAIEEAGIVPVAQTYGDSWTSQILLLADYYNVQTENPDFAELYTHNQAKFATTPAALRGFQHIEQLYQAGYFNEDFGAAKMADGLRMLANGEAAHYPALSFLVGALYGANPQSREIVGMFGVPGDDPDQAGLTMWMPFGLYIANTTAHADIAKDFLNFAATPEGCRIQIEHIGPTGPYLIQGCTLPPNLTPVIADIVRYTEEGRTAPALEFLSPVKGPALPQFTVEVGSGIRSAEDAAALYDADVEKQALQLGLPNW